MCNSPDRQVGVNVVSTQSGSYGVRSEGPTYSCRSFGPLQSFSIPHHDLTVAAISFRRFAPFDLHPLYLLIGLAAGP